MIFSIIVVNYKSVDYLKRLIVSIHRNSSLESYEIIVVDNDSGDDLTDIASLSNVYIIYNTENSGFGVACNYGSKQANGDFFLFVNPDAFFVQDVFSDLLKYYYSYNPGINHITGGTLLSREGKEQSSFGCFPSFIQDLKNIFRSLFNIKKEQHKDFSDNSVLPVKVDYVSGAFCCIPKDVFFQLNGFDSDFFLYFEETELQFRHKNNGGNCILIPNIVVGHDTSSVTIENSDFKISSLEFGRYLYFNKTRARWDFLLYRAFRVSVLIFFALIKKRKVYLDLAKFWILPKRSTIGKKMLSLGKRLDR